MVVTHIHADHVGRIPQLLAAGFKGPIICSEPSAKLLLLVLEDTFWLEHGRDDQQLARYIKLVSDRVIPVQFGIWSTVVDSPVLNCRIRLQRAGHILGSAYIAVDVEYSLEQCNKSIVFSGDLGSSQTPILPSSESPERADVLVLESAYGYRLHEDRATRQHVWRL